MISGRVKCLLVAAFSVFLTVFASPVNARDNQEDTGTEGEHKEGFNASEVIFEHILDAHEFHFFSWKSEDGEEHEIVIPLPVIVYSTERGLSIFNYSKLHHGAVYEGYKSEEGKIVA